MSKKTNLAYDTAAVAAFGVLGTIAVKADWEGNPWPALCIAVLVAGLALALARQRR